MGWLDNSTNNIILDAVLTDYGRQALARNDGSFRISRFALGDDEVDYSIITKYGRTVGREKIEKNTPVFEAFTNQNIGLKYKMISVPKPLLYLPSLSITAGNEGNTIALSPVSSPNTLSTKTLVIKQLPRGGETIDSDLQETNFDIYVPDMFLEILNTTPIGSPDVNKIAMYNMSATKGSDYPTLTMTLKVKPITDATFKVYGRSIAPSGSRIDTHIKVLGKSSGAVLDIPVAVYKP